jgi:hypothetical protein
MSPDPGAQPVTQASGRTLIDYLKEYLARPDVVKQMKPVEAAFVEFSKVYGGMFQMIGTVMQRAVKSFPSIAYEPTFVELSKVYGGMFQMAWTISQRAVESSLSIAYEPLLIEHGVKPVWAPGIGEPDDLQWDATCERGVRLPAVVGAIRFLAKPGRGRRAILPKAEVLLAAWEETSIIKTIFDDASLTESEFIGLLKSVVEGREVVWRRITEIAAAVAPHLSVPRGLKVSKASATHEFFLEIIGELPAPRAYTWNESLGKCTDPATEATRREFANSNFDPRPAYRRWKSRRIVKIS